MVDNIDMRSIPSDILLAEIERRRGGKISLNARWGEYEELSVDDLNPSTNQCLSCNKYKDSKHKLGTHKGTCPVDEVVVHSGDFCRHPTEFELKPVD